MHPQIPYKTGRGQVEEEVAERLPQLSADSWCLRRCRLLWAVVRPCTEHETKINNVIVVNLLNAIATTSSLLLYIHIGAYFFAATGNAWGGCCRHMATIFATRSQESLLNPPPPPLPPTATLERSLRDLSMLPCGSCVCLACCESVCVWVWATNWKNLK